MFEKPLTLTVLPFFLHFILNCMIHFEPQLPSGPCKGIYGGRGLYLGRSQLSRVTDSVSASAARKIQQQNGKPVRID